MARLEVMELSRSYPDEVVALQDASFVIEDGRVAALLGPSGCGKTTMLRLIAGLDRPDAGDVLLDGRTIRDQPPDQRGIGLMFQELALFPHLDVRGNIAFGLRMRHWPRDQRNARVAELLEIVGLADKGRRRIHELSGGERQRVALARALAPQPAVLLLDEPLGALDEARKQSLRAELRDVLQRVETTAVVVSHDLRDAIALADDLVVMDRGRVLQGGPLPEILAHPDSLPVALMVGYVTLVVGDVYDRAVMEDGVGGIPLPPGSRLDGGAVVVGHPSSLLGVPAGRGFGLGISGVVRRTRPEGPMFVLDVLAGGREIPVRWEWDLTPPRVGTRVDVAARPGTLRFFAAGENAVEPGASPIGLAVHEEVSAPEHPLNAPRSASPVPPPPSTRPTADGGASTPRAHEPAPPAQASRRHTGMPAID